MKNLSVRNEDSDIPCKADVDARLNNVPNVGTNDQTPTYSTATTLAKLVAGEKLGVAFGKIAKAVDELITHLSDSVKHITAAERAAWNSKAAADHVHPLQTSVSGNAGTATQVFSTAISPSTAASYQIAAHSGNTSGNKSLYNFNGLKSTQMTGTASVAGYSNLVLGNNTASGEDGNQYGQLLLYSMGTAYGVLRAYNTANNVVRYMVGTSSSDAVGSAVQSVYIDGNGLIKPCTYSLGKSVPTDAKFTDTTYSNMTAATDSADGKAGLVPAPKAGLTRRDFLSAAGTWHSPFRDGDEPAGQNLNDCKKGGVYFFVGNAMPENAPESGAGWLMTLENSSNYVKQLWFKLNSSVIYVRTCSNNTWNDWKRLALSDDIKEYSNATTTAAGLMSAADKKKLDSGYVVELDNGGLYIEI